MLALVTASATTAFVAPAMAPCHRPMVRAASALTAIVDDSPVVVTFAADESGNMKEVRETPQLFRAVGTGVVRAVKSVEVTKKVETLAQKVAPLGEAVTSSVKSVDTTALRLGLMAKCTSAREKLSSKLAPLELASRCKSAGRVARTTAASVGHVARTSATSAGRAVASTMGSVGSQSAALAKPVVTTLKATRQKVAVTCLQQFFLGAELDAAALTSADGETADAASICDQWAQVAEALCVERSNQAWRPEDAVAEAKEWADKCVEMETGKASAAAYLKAQEAAAAQSKVTYETQRNATEAAKALEVAKAKTKMARAVARKALAEQRVALEALAEARSTQAVAEAERRRLCAAANSCKSSLSKMPRAEP